jgi:CheY-like chemotaxis protein
LFFSGVNDFSLLNKIDKNTTTGTFEKKDIATNLTLVQQLSLTKHPIVLLGDNSSTDKTISQEIQGVLLQNSSIRATVLSFEKFNDVLNAVKKRENPAIILTTIGGWKDEQGQPIPVAHSIAQLTALQHPIIAMEDGYIINGVLGGYVTSGTSQGAHAGKMAKAYLNGVTLNNMPPILTSPNEFILDAQVLQAQNIQLPAELAGQAILLNPQQTFYEREKSLIVNSFYTLLALLIIGGTADIPIIALTADAMKEDVERVARAGFAGYITKPIDVPLLFSLIDRFMVKIV